MTHISEIHNKDLLHRLKDGDYDAFNQVYRQYSPALTANLIRLLKNDVLVEEVLQETFITLWERRERVDPEKSVDSYLFRISANKAKNLFKRAAYDEKMRAYFIEAIESGYEQIETKLFREENSQLLHKLLNKLPSKQREVYTLCKLEGMSYREVSERLNISESAVNSHIRRANALLKQVFVGELGIFILFLFR